MISKAYGLSCELFSPEAGNQAAQALRVGRLIARRDSVFSRLPLKIIRLIGFFPEVDIESTRA
jgi:hypothetical protein